MARVIAVTTALVVLLACAGAVAAVGKDDWKLSGIPTPNSLVKVTIGLRHPEGTYAALVGTCKSVSEPTSEAYGQYLSLEEVAAMSQSDENVALVSDFLHSFGVADLSVSPTRDSLVAVMPVRVANEAFGVDMRVFTHVDVEKARIVRSATAPTQLPARVSAAIEVIVGVSDFPTLMRSLVAEHRRRAGLAARVAAETERRASAAASTSTTGTGNAPSAPTPGLQYVSDTQTTLMVIQRCGGSISSTPQPCTGTDYPITGYEALLYVNGKEVESALPVPLSSVSAEIQPGPQANMTVYNVAVPYKLTEFQYVNVSIRAVNDYGKVRSLPRAPRLAGVLPRTSLQHVLMMPETGWFAERVCHDPLGGPVLNDGCIPPHVGHSLRHTGGADQLLRLASHAIRAHGCHPGCWCVQGCQYSSPQLLLLFGVLVRMERRW